jgi:hypothetical protein
MGHIRIGKLPKIRGWKQVIALLDSADSSSSEIAMATAKAAKDFFSQKRSDTALAFSYWVLTQITSKAKSENYVQEISEIGMDISKSKDAFDFLGRVAAFTRAQIKLRGETFPISEFAQPSLREVLTETIGQQSHTLFGATQEDVVFACRKYSRPNQFGKLARLYFAKVLNRVLQFFISKESPNRIGLGKKSGTLRICQALILPLRHTVFRAQKSSRNLPGAGIQKGTGREKSRSKTRRDL